MTSLQGLAALFILALVVEAIVEYFLPTFPLKWKWTKTYIAAGLGVLVCIAYNADLLVVLGLPPVTYIGPVLTGLIIGRGANFLNVFIKRLQVVTAPSQTVDSVPTDPPSPLNPGGDL